MLYFDEFKRKLEDLKEKHPEHKKLADELISMLTKLRQEFIEREKNRRD